MKQIVLNLGIGSIYSEIQPGRRAHSLVDTERAEFFGVDRNE